MDLGMWIVTIFGGVLIAGAVAVTMYVGPRDRDDD